MFSGAFSFSSRRFLQSGKLLANTGNHFQGAASPRGPRGIRQLSLKCVPTCGTHGHDPKLSSSRPQANVRARRYEQGATGFSGRIALALADLDDACKPSDLDLPGYRLHPLKGDLKGHWSISISGNWRMTFRLEDGDAYDVDLVDYH